MDITKPPTEHLEAIDRQLQKLEEETRMMEEMYGFDGIRNPETVVAVKAPFKSKIQPKRYEDRGTAGNNHRVQIQIRYTGRSHPRRPTPKTHHAKARNLGRVGRGEQNGTRPQDILR